MAEVLQAWLTDAGVEASNLEQDFASGWLFGKLLAAFNLQPDHDKFVNKGKPDAYLANYTRLQPVLAKLGVQLDPRTAQALINREPGLAGKVLYSIKQALGSMNKDMQALEHTGRTMQQFGMRTSPTRGMLEAQHYSTQHAAYQSSNLKFFEDVMRKKVGSPNALMESMHLKRFADEGSRQAMTAAELAAAEASAQQARKAAMREAELGKLAAARADKSLRLQRDEAVHATLLKHQDDREGQELRVELALAELGKHRQHQAQAAAAADAAAGIDAFEMTLKRLGGSEGTAEQDREEAAAGPGESPQAILGRIRAFAPTAAKLAESGGKYLATIKARRQEEVAGRKEREARRRRLLVEQQAARATSESRVAAESLLEVLVRRSGEEQRLGQRLWQLRQEKDAMEADRKLREEQYAARRDKDWEETLRREAELHRSMKAQFESSTQQELATWHEQQQQRAAAKAAAHHKFGEHVAWQVVQLAERVVEYRAATAGQAVPRRDWRAWVNLFLADDASLGSPVVATSPEAAAETGSAQQALNTAELQEYLAGQGEWVLPAEAVASSATGATAAVQQHAALGRVVAELAALAQKLEGRKLPLPAAGGSADGVDAVLTAADAAAEQWPEKAETSTIKAMPLKLAVAGGPFAGKTTVARATAQLYGLKLLTPEQLVADAIAAAQAWELQQQQQQQEPQQPEQPTSDSQEQQQHADQQPADPLALAAEPPKQVLLGQQALQELQQGTCVSDALLVELLVQGMLQARVYAPPPPEPPTVEVKGTKGGKGAAKPEPSAAGGRRSTGGAANSAGSTAGGTPGAARGSCDASSSGGAGSAVLPAHLAAAAGAQGRGFIIDGFPATAEQAVLLEKALTGLDLAAEQALVDGASLVAPPPLDALPQLQRPLVSGLDAVLVLSCKDEALAAKRALGRRLDPATGRLYHLEFDPPPANTPGLSERLVMVTGSDNDTAQVPQRLASYAAAAGPLSGWLGRFSTLRRPLDGGAELEEVLAGASDVAAGILLAKKDAQAAKAAAEAANRAKESAEKAKDYARAAQGHAEGAAGELLAAKRAELQAAALLNGGKNPDPASAEVLKAQAAAKCAEQLKVCRTAATDAAGHAERAKAAAESASAAVQRCRLSVGDASVSAEAEAIASKAAVDAEAAATAAIEAAKKAEAAKQLSEAYVAEAEKWFAATDVQADAAVPSAQQLAAAANAPSSATEDAESGAPAAGAAAGNAAAGSSASGSRALASPAALPAAAVPLLHDEWLLLEQVYTEGMGRGFVGLRSARGLALSHVAGNCSWFAQFRKRADGKQAMLQSFVEWFNAVELDMRKAKETHAELLLRSEELRDALWGICDSKHEESEAARLKLAGDGSAAEHIGLLGLHLTSLAQVELDRFLATAQFLYSYCHYAQGIYNPPGAHKPLCPLPTVLSAAATEAAGKQDPPAKPGSAAAAPPPAYLVSLQQRLPQLAAALKAATAASTATQSSAVGMVEDWSRKVAAAAATAAAANTAAAAAAAAAAGQSMPGAHKPASAVAAKAGAAAAPASAGKTSAAGAAAAASSKLAASSEEAAAAAAAAAAVVAALPQPAALAAVLTALQAALAQEVQQLQQRLALLGSKAAVIVDELVQLQAAANHQLAEWQQHRYVAECSAVAALERIVKAAAVSGQPLPHDLRLEDDVLVVDESQLLVPTPPAAPPVRPPSPAAPPGVLSVQQLQQLAEALGQAAPAGFLATADAVELMLRMASQGVLPPAWLDIDAAHMAAALSSFDPTFSGYLDWRELLLALAACSLPAIHTATPAQVAAQAAQLAAADGDADGCLTQAEFEGVRWWFEPGAEAVQAAQEEQQAAVVNETAAGQGGEGEAGAGSSAAQDVLREASRCSSFKQLLWSLFQQPAAAKPTTATADALTHNTSTAAASNAESGEADSSSARSSTAGGTCSIAAALLYLCPDRDLYQGITKAVAAVTGCAEGATVNAAKVVQICYPLLGPEQAAPLQRAPLTAAQIAAAVSAAAAAAAAGSEGQLPAASGAGAAAPTAPTGGRVGSAHQASAAGHPTAAQAAAAAAAAAAAVPPPEAALKTSQLMYSAACERVVTLLLQRYQWRDVYVAARL